MSDIGTMVAELIASGCAPEVAAKVVACAFVAGVSSRTSGGSPVDTAAEKRRAWDRERKRLERMSGGSPVESPVDADSALSVLPSSSNKLEKKERAKSSRGEKLPPDAKPTAEHYEQGLALGFGRDWVDEQFENMRIWARTNEHRAVARKSDWNLTFTGWLRRNANDAKGRNNGKVSTISSACDNLIGKLNAGFGGPAPEERLRSGESEVDARLLAYRRS